MASKLIENLKLGDAVKIDGVKGTVGLIHHYILHTVLYCGDSPRHVSFATETNTYDYMYGKEIEIV